MYRALRLVLALAAAAPLAGGCRGGADDFGTPVRVEPAALYGRFCARCHGDGGRGDTEMGRRTKAPDLTRAGFGATSAADIEQVINAGRGQMPGFGNMTTPPKIQAMAGYVRRLGMGSAAVAPGAAAQP